jgi:hypothetical protein
MRGGAVLAQCVGEIPAVGDEGVEEAEDFANVRGDRPIGIGLVGFGQYGCEALPFVRDKFRLGFVDPGSLIEATGTFHEYPMCDRDPLPRWSFGRVTLLGDAAHPMYPVGGNGASQAILDARCVARLLAEMDDVVAALVAYEAARLPVTAKIVHDNRRGGPERVIDVVACARRLCRPRHRGQPRRARVDR